MLPLALEMTFRFAPETLGLSLMLMLKGMLGIFIVIAIVWGFVALLNKLTAKKD